MVSIAGDETSECWNFLDVDRWLPREAGPGIPLTGTPGGNRGLEARPQEGPAQPVEISRCQFVSVAARLVKRFCWGRQAPRPPVGPRLAPPHSVHLGGSGPLPLRNGSRSAKPHWGRVCRTIARLTQSCPTAPLVFATSPGRGKARIRSLTETVPGGPITWPWVDLLPGRRQPSSCGSAEWTSSCVRAAPSARV